MSDQGSRPKHPVEVLTGEVTSLRTDVGQLKQGVYDRNKIDRARNWLIGISGLVLIAFIIALTIIVITNNTNAASFRHGLADCTQPPGRVLSDGYINKGECYIEGQQRTGGVIINTTNDLRKSMNCLVLHLTNTRPGPWQQVCAEVLERLEQIRSGADPFAPPSTTTTTAPPRS